MHSSLFLNNDKRMFDFLRMFYLSYFLRMNVK